MNNYEAKIHDLNLWIEVYEEMHRRYSLEVKELNSLRKKLKMLYYSSKKGLGEPIKRIKDELTFAYERMSEANTEILKLRLIIEELEEKE